jgi:hypothetical protein
VLRRTSASDPKPPSREQRPFCRGPGTDTFGRNGRLCVPIPTLRLEEGVFVSFRTDRSNSFRPTSITGLETVIGWETKIERSLITDMPRDRYVERCKQRAFDYLDRGDLKDAVASFVSNMNARPDCELPH